MIELFTRYACEYRHMSVGSRTACNLDLLVSDAVEFGNSKVLNKCGEEKSRN